MIVADASVVVEVLLQTPAAVAIEASLFDAADSLHAPALLDVEVTQVLRRYVRVGDLSPARAAVAVDLLIRFPITRYLHEPLVERMWSLRDAMTAYDAAYVALAQGLDATLLTRDAKLAGAVRRHAKVELV